MSEPHNKKQKEELTGIRQLYKDFLFYKHFVVLTSPLIITEGKTDVLYLKEALKALHNDYPQLVRLCKSNKSDFKFLIRFFNYSKQTAEIMEIRGGTADLKKLILYYHKNNYSNNNKFKSYKFKLAVCPVILLLDNDGGLSKDIKSIIKQNYSQDISIDTTKVFYHITDNLYLVKTPENITPSKNEKTSCIEDLFPEEVLKIEINDKTFDKSSKESSHNHYGKKIFAEQVVRKNAHKIDFSGFKPLLERIIGAIDDYNQKI